jgi:demethylmenaquinone methyltransferase/2-methoxy-6-polyprenyl-1,4-benzoquinol methylase
MKTKEYFDQAADTWDEKFLNSNISHFLEKNEHQFDLKTGQDVLDVGTGTGIMIPILAKAVGPLGSVTAIDFSEKMVKKCSEKYSHLKNVEIKVGNIENEYFTSNRFDAVICFGVFPHIENKKEALKNIIRILKSNGKLVIAHAMSSEELKTHHKKVLKNVVHSILPKRDEMKKLLEKVGFKQISIKDEPRSYCCIANKNKTSKNNN